MVVGSVNEERLPRISASPRESQHVRPSSSNCVNSPPSPRQANGIGVFITISSSAFLFLSSISIIISNRTFPSYKLLSPFLVWYSWVDILFYISSWVSLMPVTRRVATTITPTTASSRTNHAGFPLNLVLATTTSVLSQSIIQLLMAMSTDMTRWSPAAATCSVLPLEIGSSITGWTPLPWLPLELWLWE